MNINEFRQQMESYRAAVDAEAREQKHSQLALRSLFELYRGLDGDERRMANAVVNEWLLSDDEAVRFDALALVDEFTIGAASAVLGDLARRLRSSSSPGAPFELEKIERIVARLSSA